MKKILSLICLMMLAMTSAWSSEVATFDLGTKNGISTPEGFFKSVGEKWNWNNKFTGGEYDGKTFSNGLKMESSTKIGFTTAFESTVTIVQSTWSANTIKLDDVELAVADAEAGTGCRIYTVTGVAAGDHVIGRGSGESGLFYIKVEWNALKTVTFINDANWETVYVYAWGADNKPVTEEWPGTQLTAGEDGNYTWSTTADPIGILFNNGSAQTADQDFKDGGVYNSTGRVITLKDFTATFKTDGMDEVWAYVWKGDEKALGDWPGTKMDGADGEFTVTIQAEEAPDFIIFHNNAGDQTADLTFEDGKIYEYMLNEYAVTFTTDGGWETVNAYAWSGDKKFLGDWPGTELTATDGVYALSFKAFVVPENIIFNNGSDEGKTPDLAFIDGKAYKWITATPFYALKEGDAFESGTTVDLTDATITYGVEGGQKFGQYSNNEFIGGAFAASHEDYAGFGFMVAGNNVNGSADDGTVYTIVPKYDGTITIGVRLNGGKKMHINEDGNDMEGYAGFTIKDAANTSYDFAVKAGSTYKIWCDGSKLGFFGFDYKYEKPQDSYSIIFKTNADWDKVYAYAWTGDGESATLALGEWPGTEMSYNKRYSQYELSFTAEAAPEKILFNNGNMGGRNQTDDLEFENQKIYEYYVTESELMAEAKALASDADAVAVGKLLKAIQDAEDNDDESGLQEAVDQFKADNADQEKDETAKVATDGWKKFDGSAAGVCDTIYAPAIITYDGRKNVKLAECYEGNTAGVERTGTIIYQDITGLSNGKYKVGFYGNAFFTAGRGFDSPMANNAEDVAYVFANEEKEFIVAKIATETKENDFRQFDVDVTDGTIKLGMGKEKAGTNWHTIQIYQLTWFTTAKEVYAELKAELGELLNEALNLLNDETKTEGKEALRLAYGEGSAAYDSNWYNITEMEDKVNALKQTIADFKKANWFIDFTAGEYYIIDVESGLMMGAGNDWGTHGVVNEIGLDLTLTPYTESRTVTIDSRVSNGGNSHYLSNELYMDSKEWGWAFEYQGFGFYILEPDGGKYINIDRNNNLVLSNTPREFILVDKDGVMAQLLDEMSEATKDEPVDATRLIKANNFNRNDQRNAEAWIISDDCTNFNLSGGNNVNNCAESLHSTFTIMQTISGAPAGFYQLTAQGFYRQDTFEGEEAPAAPMFFANEVNCDIPERTGTENTMSEASESFTNGLYTIEPITFEVKEDGMMYVGITASTNTQWVIWDNFTLQYFGSENPTVGISEVKTAAEQNAAIYNLAGQRVTKAQKGLLIVNGKKVVK